MCIRDRVCDRVNMFLSCGAGWHPAAGWQPASCGCFQHLSTAVKLDKRTHSRGHGTSVVLLRGEPLVPELRGSALLGALQNCEAELNQGAIVTLDWTDKPRARVLPLR